MTDTRADLLCEASWEVCNKVGGINTVLKSKAALMAEAYKEYYLVGPYFEEKAALELQQEEPPQHLARAFDDLKSEGIIAHYGTWQIKGEPKAILLNFSSLTPNKDVLKTQLYEWYGIDSLGAGWEYEEPVLFSAAVAKLLAAIERHRKKARFVAHFHEWMTGAALLFLGKTPSRIKTVFTTHATMLGRAICGGGGALYERLHDLDPVKEAYAHGVQAKHLTESAAARNATVFTTVSEITGLEAEKLLGRKPDVLVLNGLDISRFPTIEETSIKHLTCRERLRDYLAYHFFPHYVFPLEHNLIFFITGRYEFRNKGIDLTIKALGRLNRLLQEQDDDRSVSVFFWIPMGHTGVRVELLENKNYYHQIQHYIEYNSESILKKVLYDFLANKDVKGEGLFTQEFLKDMQRDLLHFKRPGNPLMSTNYLDDEGRNELVNALLAAGLDNREDDKVKTVLMPFYLDGADGLINLPYYDAIAGSHLGLFPSYYEPWGYTPLETAALGVSALTTDLAGFGRYIEPHIEEEFPGMTVLHRLDRPEDEVVEEFAQQLLRFTQLNHADRVQNKISAKKLAEKCDWKEFIHFYFEAHNLALER